MDITIVFNPEEGETEEAAELVKKDIKEMVEKYSNIYSFRYFGKKVEIKNIEVYKIIRY